MAPFFNFLAEILRFNRILHVDKISIGGVRFLNSQLTVKKIQISEKQKFQQTPISYRSKAQKKQIGVHKNSQFF
jgi:hypothetical protein